MYSTVPSVLAANLGALMHILICVSLHGRIYIYIYIYIYICVCVCVCVCCMRVQAYLYGCVGRVNIHVYTWMSVSVELATFSRGGPEGSFFNNYYTKVYGRALFLSLDCSHFTLDPYLILLTVKQGSIFLVFGMTRPGIEPRSPGPLANTLLIRPIAR